MLPKPNRLTKSDEIRATMKTGQRVSNQSLTFHYTSGSGRFAFITPKSIGNAVLRNLVRRRGRAILAQHLADLTELDGVLRFHPGTSTKTFADLSFDIQDLVRRATK